MQKRSRYFFVFPIHQFLNKRIFFRSYCLTFREICADQQLQECAIVGPEVVVRRGAARHLPGLNFLDEAHQLGHVVLLVQQLGRVGLVVNAQRVLVAAAAVAAVVAVARAAAAVGDHLHLLLHQHHRLGRVDTRLLLQQRRLLSRLLQQLGLVVLGGRAFQVHLERSRPQKVIFLAVF